MLNSEKNILVVYVQKKLKKHSALHTKKVLLLWVNLKPLPKKNSMLVKKNILFPSVSKNSFLKFE
jgi:hypothetical protein